MSRTWHPCLRAGEVVVEDALGVVQDRVWVVAGGRQPRRDFLGEGFPEADVVEVGDDDILQHVHRHRRRRDVRIAIAHRFRILGERNAHPGEEQLIEEGVLIEVEVAAANA